MGFSRSGLRDAARVERAKGGLLTDEPFDFSTVPDPILGSWRRSKFWGVSPDTLDPPFFDEIDVQGKLASAALPAIDHLEAVFAGTSMCVILTDRHGRVLQRRSEDSALLRHLDSIHLATGFSYAEEHVGTNGIGSAIEEREPFFVAGAEHFVHPLATVSCAGAPIVHPTTGRLEGVLDLTCRAGDATPLMQVIASEAARGISQLLLEQSSAAERSLFQEFVAANRRSVRAIVAVNEGVVITNTAAARLLNAVDHDVLSDAAQRMISTGRQTGEIQLSIGLMAKLHLRSTAACNGIVLELSVPRRSEARSAAPPSGLSRTELSLGGHSVSWERTLARVAASCRARERLLVVGEPGTGKLSLIVAAHRGCHPDLPLEIIRPTSLAPNRGADHEAFASTVPATGGTAVLQHLHTLSRNEISRITDWVRRRGRKGGLWIAATFCAAANEGVPDELTLAFDAVVEVPPLRYRVEDVRDLVPKLLERLAPGKGVTVGQDAMQLLLRHPWGGNVAELEASLHSALTHRSGAQIKAEDLPATIHSTKRGVLSEWEARECDLIVTALLEAEGDKVKAAQRLGISRATIYRKLRSYGIIP